MSKCPICYRTINEEDSWSHDPCLLPNGSKYKWTDDSELELEEVSEISDRFYKGFQTITIDIIKELQDNRKQLESENLLEVDRTEFTPLNDTGYFQFTEEYISELRESTEKILNALSISKIEYFNYDEDGNHIIHPNGDKTEWTDDITDETELEKFQIKAIHIEDLRHYIREFLMERWNSSDTGIISTTEVFWEGHPNCDWFGDIGVEEYALNPWTGEIHNPQTDNPYILYPWEMLQSESGYYYLNSLPVVNQNIPINSVAEISDIVDSGEDANIYLKITCQNSGYIGNNQFYPPSPGWSSDGLQYWKGSYVVYVSGSTSGYGFGNYLANIHGLYWLKGLSIITSNRIWNMDLSLNYVCNYAKLDIETVHNETTEYPLLNFNIYIKDTATALLTTHKTIYSLYYGHPSATYIVGITRTDESVIDRRDLSELLIDENNNIELDLWNEITDRLVDIYYLKDEEGNPVLDPEGNKIPTMKYIKDFYLTVYLDRIVLAVSGAIGNTEASGSFVAGSVNITKLDNIGLKPNI